MNLQELCDRPHDCPCAHPAHVWYHDRLWACATNGHALILVAPQYLKEPQHNQDLEDSLDKALRQYKEGAEHLTSYKDLSAWAKPTHTCGLLFNRTVDRRLLNKWLCYVPLRDSTVLVTEAGERDPILFRPYSDEWRLYIMPYLSDAEGPSFNAASQPDEALEQKSMGHKQLLDRMGRPVDRYGQLLSLTGWETDCTDA